MTVRHNTKAEELKILLERIFYKPAAGYKNLLAIFEIGREIKDPYCLEFNDLGYTSDYKQFEPEKVVNTVVSVLTERDDLLISFIEKYWDRVWKYSTFYGEHYTFDSRQKDPKKTLRLGSRWSDFRKNLETVSVTYGKSNVTAYLNAVWEACMKIGKRYNNFTLVRQLFKEHGGKQSFLDVSSRVDSFGIIDYRKSGRGVDISIKEEVVPFVGDILQKDP